MTDKNKTGEAPGTAESATNGTPNLVLMGKHDILGVEDVLYKIVPVRAWSGRPVRLKSLSAAEKEAWEASVTTTDEKGTTTTDMSKGTVRASLVIQCMVDADGARVMDDSYTGQLATKSAAAMQQLFDECRELNGMGKLEDAVKN